MMGPEHWKISLPQWNTLQDYHFSLRESDTLGAYIQTRKGEDHQDAE